MAYQPRIDSTYCWTYGLLLTKRDKSNEDMPNLKLIINIINFKRKLLWLKPEQKYII